MQKLAKREEQIMQAFWKLKKAFIKEVLAEMPSPQPHYNTMSTMVRILEDKGFLAHESLGNTFRYYPEVSKEDYQKQALGDLVKNYFEGSASNLVMFFAREHLITESEFQDILENIRAGEL